MDLKFVPIQSFIDSSFFTKLSELKLNDFKLDDKPQSVLGSITDASKLNKFNNRPILNLDYKSYDITDVDSKQIKGQIHNVNTIEEFKDKDKQQLIQTWGKNIIDNYNDDCLDVIKFHLLTFCDLKKYKFYYWLAFPILNSKWEVDKREKSDDYINELIQCVLQGSSRLVSVKNRQVMETLSTQSTNEFIYIDNCLENDRFSIELKNYLYYFALKRLSLVILHIYKQNESITLNLRLVEKVDPSDVKVTGWERTSQGKLGPKLANLGSLIDPHQLASQAVDLNLKLMKWRIAPKLNLDIIKDQRVLLLGAGTLGSYVSRALLGWGVNEITFVDNGRISYSNPVRQPLFNFKDCFSADGQGDIKATRAAEALKEIYPGVNAKGIEMEVPMIGHPVSDEVKLKTNFDQLNELFDSHDVVFLLMDSRESRWLPTVLGLAKNKLVINAALGFDSYLVIRHGNISKDCGQERLGCYYCNDVVAPDDSLSDRTLDQMCTVTRPGAALMASSLAVELMVSVLQHPLSKYASASDTGILGETPHHIRGFLNNFQQHKLSTPNYKHCSACSNAVIQHFTTHGWSFIRDCLNDSKYLEGICGLTDVQRDAEKASEEVLNLLEDLDIEDDDEWLS